MFKRISLISWLVVLFYFLLGVFTFISISYSTDARNLFSSTEFFMQFNLVWFGILISVYGIYTLIQNYRKITRLGLEKQTLDTQFLIVLSFVFLTIHVVLDYFLYSNTNIEVNIQFALDSTSKVMLYGALMAGFLSILLPKLLKSYRKSNGV